MRFIEFILTSPLLFLISFMIAAFLLGIISQFLFRKLPFISIFLSNVIMIVLLLPGILWLFNKKELAVLLSLIATGLLELGTIFVLIQSALAFNNCGFFYQLQVCSGDDKFIAQIIFSFILAPFYLILVPVLLSLFNSYREFRKRN